MPITQCSQGEWTVKGIGAEPCFIPKSDGSDYDDAEVQPSLSDIPFAMREANDYHIRLTRKPIYDFVVVAIGKINYDATRVVSGISKVTDATTVNRIRMGTGTYREKMQHLFDNYEAKFDHVSAIVVKPATS